MSAMMIENRIKNAFSCTDDDRAGIFLIIMLQLEFILAGFRQNKGKKENRDALRYLGLSASDFQQTDATVGSLLLQSRFGPDVREWLEE